MSNERWIGCLWRLLSGCVTAKQPDAASVRLSRDKGNQERQRAGRANWLRDRQRYHGGLFSGLIDSPPVEGAVER